jgi:hypothetical protein
MQVIMGSPPTAPFDEGGRPGAEQEAAVLERAQAALQLFELVSGGEDAPRDGSGGPLASLAAEEGVADGAACGHPLCADCTHVSTEALLRRLLVPPPPPLFLFWHF